jgi:tetratricopeptide (TPR) repeat protein
MTQGSAERARVLAIVAQRSSSRLGFLTIYRGRLLLTVSVLASAVVIAGCGNSPSALSAANALIAQGLRAESSGKVQQAAADFRAAAAKDPKDAVPYYDLGVLYQQVAHDPTQAAMDYKKALSIDHTFRQSMFNLAIVDTPTQPQAAMNLYNELLVQNPRDANAYFNLGLLLIAQGQAVPGHATLKKAIVLNPALAKKVPAGITP